MYQDEMQSYSTLGEVLRYRANNNRDRLAYVFLDDGGSKESELTYGKLDSYAQTIAAMLEQFQVSGERILLVYPSGHDFIAALFGCSYAGAIAVPATAPASDRMMNLLSAIIADAKPKLALTTSEVYTEIERLAQPGMLPPSLQWHTTDLLSYDSPQECGQPSVTGDSIALIQYTTGADNSPRGIVMSHRNVLRNQRMIKEAFDHTSESTFVGWLPTSRDAGLMGNVLQPLYIGATSVLMSPNAFLDNPMCWLQTITDYKGKTSGGPNFAYEICIRQIKPEDRTSLDLSSWTVAFNGSEPIHSRTIEEFTQIFSPFGFRKEAFCPCYGIGEATMFIAGSSPKAPPVSLRVEKGAWERGYVVRAKANGIPTETIVSNGLPAEGERVIIVDPDTRQLCPPDRLGEIWVSGPNVAEGYWNRPAETDQTFRGVLGESNEGPFLRTGDLGFINNGELFVSGDVIIIDGSNHYPQDIEGTVAGSHPSLKAGCGAAFTVNIEGEERLVIVQEVDPGSDFDQIISNINHEVGNQSRVLPQLIVLIEPGTIPRASNGKVQRRTCRTGFMENSLRVLKLSRAEGEEGG